MIKKVEEFNKKYMNPLDIHSRILDIQSELGELSKEILKATNYGQSKFIISDDLIMEYGDVLYSLLSFGIENNIEVEQALKNALSKYEKRFSKKGHIGSNE